MHDTEDKLWWTVEGVRLELEFLRAIVPLTGEDIRLNPAKGLNPLAPDFIHFTSGRPMDLKSQQTPFFKASELYGVDPTYAVTLNHKDIFGYSNRYPDIIILFHVNWRVLSRDFNGVTYVVQPVNAVWRADLAQIANAERKHHSYQRRQNDRQGNAKSSACLDVRQFDLMIDLRGVNNGRVSESVSEAADI